jgi:glycosyltransferase involved in cell wall biosynthesis
MARTPADVACQDAVTGEFRKLPVVFQMPTGVGSTPLERGASLWLIGKQAEIPANVRGGASGAAHPDSQRRFHDTDREDVAFLIELTLMAFSWMTIAIASYQRRESLLRLLHGLDAQLAASAALREDLDVLVVLDGSTDGSREAVESSTWSVPVHVKWQENQGLAAVRNVGLRAAAGHLVWFLDDDLVPGAGLVDRHRRAHGRQQPCVVVGPCRIPPEVDAPAPLRRWWDEFYAGLANVQEIKRYDLFTVANASAPADLLLSVGGFDEDLVGYGLEDYELAIRLIAADVRVQFDADAVAWHPDIPPMPVLVHRQQDIGRNSARIVLKHPDFVDEMFPPGRTPRPRRLLRWSRIRQPKPLMRISRLSLALSRLALPRYPRVARSFEHMSRAAAHAAGVSEGDPSGMLLGRVLGYTR